MNSVTINGYNLQSEYGLVLPSYDIPAPEPFLYMVAVDGHDGLVDLSNAFGRTFFKNREWNLNFKLPNPSANWHTTFSSVLSRFHGKRVPFIFDDDSTHTWIGRITVDRFNSNQGEGNLALNISSEPYKYNQTATEKTETVSGTKTITLSNADMPVCPIITVSSEMQITFTGVTDPAASGLVGYGIVGQMTVGANSTITATITGTAQIPQFVIPQGGTTVSVTGNGTIKFTYTEGLL